ncbi:tetratricopeptide repeat protein 39C-like isoform X2 [Macrosteles quadrilineatus]|uniref:tetratricopeptide repeat protein 39C-like isoform X2 n=1 Tax=Macrosteles quadrilineatus TaxID=74068 RepID=UPI0023E1070E|nr:tetratricopeptide repeat protein 39C-like isoform X2 [Macrosteles quadrilineatus]
MCSRYWLAEVHEEQGVWSDEGDDKNEGERLEEQVVLADTQVCLALLTFLQHDVTGCVRGGWVLRKAWKVYQHTYNQILALYRQTFGDEKPVPGSDFPPWRVVTGSPSLLSPLPQSPSCDWSTPGSPTPLSPSTPTSPSGYLNGYRNSFTSLLNSFSPTPQCHLDPEEVSRLMCAVSFGYGVFQLCLSLLPASLLRLIQLLGFGGDRNVGLEALMFARKGTEMRAPLATLALLWYHTIVRPFLALDGTNVQAGLETAEILITESQPEFSNSALFIFFTGRIHRLKSNIPAALEAYLSAVDKSPQREVQLLCLHEVSWCYLIQLEWGKAYQSFMMLKRRSRWSKIFYTYLAAVCAGANEQPQESSSLAGEIVEFLDESTTSRTQLEDFIGRRASMLASPSSPVSPAYCRLLAYEMLFLWNALPSTQYNCVISRDCETAADCEPMVGLRSLILGSVQSCLGLRTEAVSSLRAALSARQHLPNTAQDSHVSAFALYELARLLLQETYEYKEEAKALLERAQRDFKGYDFESRLNVRIHAALRALGQ